MKRQGDVKFFIFEISRRLGRPLIDEWENGASARLEYPRVNLHLEKISKEELDPKLDQILPSLAQRMHVSLDRETRNIETYILTAAAKRGVTGDARVGESRGLAARVCGGERGAMWEAGSGGAPHANCGR